MREGEAISFSLFLFFLPLALASLSSNQLRRMTRTQNEIDSR
jgi:hypothetical protein